MSVYDKGEPHVREMKKDETIFVCRCGLSSSPPYCDASHTSTGKSPLVYTADNDGPVYFCGCGKSGNIPFCDGSHNG